MKTPADRRTLSMDGREVMRAIARIGTPAFLLLALVPAMAGGFELEEGINAAGIINFPTAINQPTDHTLHGSLELTDIGEPDLHLYNLRYGLQLGGLQFLADFNYAIEPEKEFDFAEFKVKYQLLNLEEFRLSLAFGALGRFVEESEERQARIDDRTASLLVIASMELFPFTDWGGFLFNFYLDNRSFVVGLKVQIYQSIQFVAEGELLHDTLREDDKNGWVGVSFEGDQNGYFQFLFTDQGDNYLIQVGTGF